MKKKLKRSSMNEETNEERKTNEKNILIITYELFIGSCQHILFIYFLQINKTRFRISKIKINQSNIYEFHLTERNLFR